MNLSSNLVNLHFEPIKQTTFFNPRTIALRTAEFRFHYRKKRRFKHPGKLLLVNSSIFECLNFQNFTSHLESLAPTAIGLASGFALNCALQLKKFSRNFDQDVSGIVGEWVLFTSPTPFNRFVFLRCPSVSFDGSESLHDVNERLVKEDRHFVRLDSGKIRNYVEDGNVTLESVGLDYQRVCLSTEDGGVVSLDWPSNLDLKEERGLDTTVLLVPGTPQGSMDGRVRSFVCEAVKRGLFPVVMNPRGCAGSPLTTSRLFTAADSDDICTAVQFINKARPWTTLMGVGWGYGANMLTKYLAEVGEKTPLTAATCIDNPFDLEEATRCHPHHIAVDQKLTGGLVDILRSNKELFQGRSKAFEVEKALSATSVRDFEEAISMVSYGFESLEEFYLTCSTRGAIGNVKIPVLFIQNGDGTVPLFSIPRGLIAENPFTNLLLCYCPPSSTVAMGGAAVSWYQNLTLEWLAAVELGLLKGRHPLLKDIDLTISPLNSSGFVEGRASNKGDKVENLVDITQSNVVNGYTVDHARKILEDSKTATIIPLKSRRGTPNNMELDNQKSQGLGSGTIPQTSSAEAELVQDDEPSANDERGQVLQTTQVIMNMLDVTLPGTLKEEEKKKVLAAVDQGETVMKALQDAVPEDVREKLTATVSGILHAQGTNLKFDKLLDIGRISKLSSGFRQKTQEQVRGLSGDETPYRDPHSSEQIKRSEDMIADNARPGMDKRTGDLEGSEVHFSENSPKSDDHAQQMNVTTLDRKGSNSTGINHEIDENLKEKTTQPHDPNEKDLETGIQSSITSQEKEDGNEEAIGADNRLDQDVGVARTVTKEENLQKNEEKSLDASGTMAQEAASSSTTSSECHPMENEGTDNPNNENKNSQAADDHNKSTLSDSNPSSFSVSQALDALTGIDDSTQVAVNSVFGVIENMITQLEEENDGGNESYDENSNSATGKQENITSRTVEKKEDNENGQSDGSHDHNIRNEPKNNLDSNHDAKVGWVEEPTQDPILFKGTGVDGLRENHRTNESGMDGKNNNQLVGNKILHDFSDRNVNNILSFKSENTYREPLHDIHFPGNLLSKLPTSKSLDVDTTTALLLDYYPEEGQWILLEQPESSEDSSCHTSVRTVETARENDIDNFIEPAYVVLDSEQQQDPIREYEKMDNRSRTVEEDSHSSEFMHFVKIVMLDSLKIEVDRRLSAEDMKEMASELARDVEKVADAVSFSIGHDADHTFCCNGRNHSIESIDCTPEKIGNLRGDSIIKAISSSAQSTTYLRRLLPLGVIVGSSLAALRKYFHVSTAHDNGPREFMAVNETNESGKKDQDKTIISESVDRTHRKSSSKRSTSEVVEDRLRNISKDGVMVGAVTAALGASALLVQQQDPRKTEEFTEISSKSFKEKGYLEKGADKLNNMINEKNQANIVTSLAEKAMSVAGPVVPTKEDGEVDQERIVAVLVDLGQKGGILRLAGKVALLWGGIRGAMSLTDKLILFLHIAERPLLQRVLGFTAMVLVLWSPVVVPLLPTLVQGWTTRNPFRMAELACITGLYAAVLILVTIWGKRIREYDNPLEQYGLDFTSLRKVQDLLKGLIGGIMVVLSIQYINTLIGCVSFSCPPSFASSLDAMTKLKAYGRILMLACQGIITATGIVVVEELVFRAWLPEEIAPDLGYFRGIVISGLVFSLFNRSLRAMPGLWLLSMALSGARQRSKGSLAIPVGLRTGIVSSSFILQRGGFLTYRPNFPLWVSGTHTFEPFSGVVGFAFSLLLVIILYPRPLQKRKN